MEKKIESILLWNVQLLKNVHLHKILFLTFPHAESLVIIYHNVM